MVSTVKMVIAVRKDLDLGKGKIAAQVAHAAVLCVTEELLLILKQPLLRFHNRS